MTRSLDSWSGGLCQTEISILNSYCDLINKAEHFIYIEVIEFYSLVFKVNLSILYYLESIFRDYN